MELKRKLIFFLIGKSVNIKYFLDSNYQKWTVNMFMLMDVENRFSIFLQIQQLII